MDTSFVLRTVEALVIDMDGVLWRGATALPGLAPFFAFLRARGIPFVLATNNASHTPDTYIARLAGYSITVRRDEILTSALATAAFARRTYPDAADVFVVGGPGLCDALTAAGFALVERTTRRADLVVAGVDFGLTYDKLADAAIHLQRGAQFIGTNDDPTYPAEDGLLLPGAGTILAALTHCTGVHPTVIGKPARPMFDIATERLARSPEHVAMIGDRLSTDILGGQRAGLRTILVTTGVDDAGSVEASGIRPDAVFAGLPEIVAAWREVAS
jgi:4-nitrophenyl phosphatase